MKCENILLEICVIAIAATLFTTGCPGKLINKSYYDRELDVKSNIHEIQIALERYAVDTGGVYPNFLIGAERDNNIISNHLSMDNNGVSVFPEHGITPWALAYNLESEKSMVWTSVDPLIAGGYISEYPVNPFTRECGEKFKAEGIDLETETGIFPYAGLKGDKMFDLGFGWGDTPQTDYFILADDELTEEREARISGGTRFSDPDLDAPGNFYYHPIFSDLIPVYYHYAAQYDVVNNGPSDWETSVGIREHKVFGYCLYGYGAPGPQGAVKGGGLDYFNRMPLRAHLPEDSKIDTFLPDGTVLDTSVNFGEQQERVETTGYPGQEYDPWTTLFADGINPANPSSISPLHSGDDGITDWVIIEVNSGVSMGNDITK